MMNSETKNITTAYFILLLLLGGTLMASRLQLGGLEESVALAFSLAKAAVILISFMHIRKTIEASRIYFFLGLFTLAVLVVGVLDDLMTREI